MDAERITALIGALGTIVAAFVGVLTWYLASRTDRRRERERARGRAARDAESCATSACSTSSWRCIPRSSPASSPTAASSPPRRRAMRSSRTIRSPPPTRPTSSSIRCESDLSILPAEVIHAVVQYYRVAKQSNLLTRDLRDPAFLAQSAEEKRRIIRILLRDRGTAENAGRGRGCRSGGLCARHGLDLHASEAPRHRSLSSGAPRFRGDLQEIGTIGPVIANSMLRGTLFHASIQI